MFRMCAKIILSDLTILKKFRISKQSSWKHRAISDKLYPYVFISFSDSLVGNATMFQICYLWDTDLFIRVT